MHHKSGKRVVLVFNRYYLPGYRAGGPIRTLANTVTRLGDEFDFRIITLNHDAGLTSPYHTAPDEEWTTVGKALVMYMPPTRITIRKLMRLVRATAPEVIYLNSFLDPCFTQRILWARRLGYVRSVPIIIAPRGEFSPGALSLKSAQKHLYVGFSHLMGLYSHLTWQASSDLERGDILKALPWVNPRCIRTVMNLGPIEARTLVGATERASGAPLRVCFLSRVSPMKNLDFAITALTHVATPVHFTIYGPQEVPEYWAQCKKHMASLPPHVSVTYAGAVPPDEVFAQLSRHDLFLLPTRGENYGHVIYEALASGLPVLISDQTPWRTVRSRGVGWSVPLDDPARFARIIEEVATWSPERLMATRESAKRFAAEHAAAEDVLQANIELFQNPTGLAPK